MQCNCYANHSGLEYLTDLLLIYLWHGSLFAGGTRGVQNAATTEHCNITISTLIGGVLEGVSVFDLDYN